MSSRKFFDGFVKEAVQFMRDVAASALGLKLAGVAVEASATRTGVLREAHAFEKGLRRLESGAPDEVLAAGKIQSWYRLIRTGDHASYQHPRTGELFRYDLLYGSAVVSALNTYLGDLQADEDRDRFLIAFGQGTDESRDATIMRLRSDRFYQFTTSAGEVATRAVEDLGIHDAVRRFNDAAQKRLEENAKRRFNRFNRKTPLE